MNNISLIARADLLLFCLILDIVIFTYLKKHSSKENYSARLFERILIVIAALTLAEAVSWLTGEFGNKSQIPIHYWSNFFFLGCAGLPPALAFSYLDYKIFHDEEKSKKRLLIYLIPAFINICFAICNLFDDGFFFCVNEMNQYSRGIGINIGVGILYIFFIAVLAFFSRKRRMITGRTVQSILLFFFIPIIGSFLQTMAYGVTLAMPSYTLATFIIFLILEKDEMDRDELTDLYTRAKMRSRLSFKLKSSDPFTVIMADLDGFKDINDTYGHAEGDKVLIKVAEVLKQIVNVEDMVCRYGGDEFLILVEFNKDIAEKVISRIDTVLSKHNQSVDYKISMSYGHEFIDNPSEIDLEDLLHRIDQKMYDNKQRRKANNH